MSNENAWEKLSGKAALSDCVTAVKCRSNGKMIIGYRRDNSVSAVSFYIIDKDVMFMTDPLRGYVYIAKVNGKYGSEQHGTRPVVVVQNDKGNLYSTTTIVVPITSRDKHYLPTHVALSTNIFEKQSMALAEQVMTVSKDRLTRFIGALSFSDMQKIDKALRISLEI